MGVSFLYEIERPKRAKTFKNGTSSDIAALEETFGGKVSTKDIATLHAMHRATHQKESLWSDIVHTLETLCGDDFANEITLVIWKEF